MNQASTDIIPTSRRRSSLLNKTKGSWPFSLSSHRNKISITSGKLCAISTDNTGGKPCGDSSKILLAVEIMSGCLINSCIVTLNAVLCTVRLNVFSVGVKDPNRRLFDALIPLPKGTSYNSFLIVGSEKIALVDTVNPGFEKEFP